jgi:hypothetical protein
MDGTWIVSFSPHFPLINLALAHLLASVEGQNGDDVPGQATEHEHQAAGESGQKHPLRIVLYREVIVYTVGSRTMRPAASTQDSPVQRGHSVHSRQQEKAASSIHSG